LIIKFHPWDNNFSRIKGEVAMGSSITDIESGITKIETLIKSLRDDRDKARAEAAELKRLLEERELELLQMDEDRQEERRGFEERISETRKTSESLETRLAELAERIKNLMSLVTEYAPADLETETFPASPDDRT
jgi:predicted RNase H-like nuclease (RuvC/YqgF family)